ncbi:probable aspartyl aminopeptidase [Phtheirospermum japonicum]|uniref:Probable aspartyl aminopeptidase n=1 Tax=Phtheirospermum japonicum TaxID=374723 RepID=A0A830DDF2_9LAMI|nr:probable aspartyl aminopeptidase [Phtheirospermum japonicum]
MVSGSKNSVGLFRGGDWWLALSGGGRALAAGLDYSSLIPGNMQVQGAVQLGQSAGPVDNSQVQSVVEPGIDNNYQQQGVDNNGGCQFPKITKGGFLEVGVQPYKGGLCHTWFDRDLAIAGRVIVREQKDGPESCSHWLVRIEEPIVRILTLAIHLDREVNDGFKINKQSHLAPILATSVKVELNKSAAVNSSAISGHRYCDTRISTDPQT